MARLVAALSGGVDSAVAAMLAIEAGHDVIGVHLRLSDTGSDVVGEGCCGIDASRDTRLVAAALGIDLYVWDFRELFANQVYDRFADAYASGVTPNPCVRCNENVKHHGLIVKARGLGFDAMITGHYVQVLEDDGQPQLARGVDSKKDQSYVLHRISQSDLAATVAPIGGMEKPAVRDLAEAAGLPVARKADSVDLCFIPDGDTQAHLAGRLPVMEGEIVHEDGRALGQHDGIWNFTVGQRRGLGLGTHERLFVTRIDAAKNRVVVGPRESLATATLHVEDMHWLGEPLRPGAECRVQMRAHGRTVVAQLAAPGVIELNEPLYGIANGQSCVLYSLDDRICLGGGPVSASQPGKDPIRTVAPPRVVAAAR